MATVNTKKIAISVASTQTDYSIVDVISSGDTGAYTLEITFTDIVSIAGFCNLHFVLGDGSVADRDASDGVTISTNKVTYAMEAGLYTQENLVCYVQFNNTNLYTPLKLIFKNIRSVAGGEVVAVMTQSYPAWYATSVVAEAARVVAESGRVSAESGRVSAENSRVSTESGRVTAEGTRVSSEATRVSNENTRIGSENTRISAESSRVSAESGRTSAEVIRASSEVTRVSSENTRISNESGRTTAEGLRVTAESSRVGAESSRVTAEGLRVTAENGRSAKLNNYAIASGTNDYVVTLDPVISAYTAGLVVHFLAGNKNTGACTLNCNALGAKSIKKSANVAIASSEILAGQVITVIYDGTNFQMVSGSGGSSSLIPVYNRVTLGSASASVTIGITGFDKDKDILYVYANSTFIAGAGYDYTVATDSLTITKVTGTWDAGTIFDFSVFQVSDTASDALGLASFISTFTSVANGTTVCSLSGSNFNVTTDVLHVYYQNLLLFLTDDYTVAVDGSTITLVGFTLSIGETLKYEVLKKIRQDLSTTDGSLLQAGSVARTALASGVQSELTGKLNLAGGASNPLTAMPFVGTAPIVESGSNGNGSYVKFADGTMICYGSKSNTANITTSAGSLFLSDALTIAFPATFYASPSIQVCHGGQSVVWFAGGVSNITDFSPYYMMSAISRATFTFLVWYTAIGRWKA